MNRKTILWLLFSFAFIALLAPAPAAVTTQIDYTDGAGEGFNDPTFGTSRRTAFEYAVNLWAEQLIGTVTIRISAQFNSLGGNMTTAIAGTASPEAAIYDFVGAPLANTQYYSALADQLGGQDLDPGNPDINVEFNSDIDGPVVLGANSWYYGTDANPPGNDVDLVTTALHELAHGLGFRHLINPANGEFLLGIPDIFSRQLTHQGVGDFDAITDVQRFNAITSDAVFWKGPNVVSAHGGQVKMHAPSPYEVGSSISHWDISNFPNLLMEPVDTGATHEIDLTKQAFQDIGWQFVEPPECLNFVVSISSANEVPPTNTGGGGSALLQLNTVANTLSFRIYTNNLSSAETVAHFHGPAPPGMNAAAVFTLPAGATKSGVWNYPENVEEDILDGLYYINVHTSNHINGEVRGQIENGTPCELTGSGKWDVFE